MTTTDSTPQYLALENGVVVGNDGSDIGKVGQVYTDNDTGAPSWVTVKTGWFGTSESFVPLNSATVEGDSIQVPFDKDTIKGAPHNEAGEPLSEDDEQELYAYYGLDSEPRLGPPRLLRRSRRRPRAGVLHRGRGYRHPPREGFRER